MHIDGPFSHSCSIEVGSSRFPESLVKMPVLPHAAASASNLGTDHVIGAKCRIVSGALRRKRLEAMTLRKKHIKQCRRMMRQRRHRMHKVERNGLLPAATFGARVGDCTS